MRKIFRRICRMCVLDIRWKFIEFNIEFLRHIGKKLRLARYYLLFEKYEKKKTF